MGWTIRLKSDMPITENEVEEALKHVTENPKVVTYPRHVFKNAHGWTAAVDVNKPQGNEIRLSGSSTISGHYAIAFAEDFRTALIQQCGHHIPDEITASY